MNSMNGSSGPNKNPTDAFTGFWSEMFGKMSGAGMGAAWGGASPEDTQRQMRQAFFDSWQKYCEDYMKSPAFLDMMKQSMDNALAFRRQVNEFLGKALQEGQMPSRGDTDSILLAVRRMEERVLERMDSLSRRVEDLEARTGEAGRGAAPSAAAKARTKGR